MAKDIRKLVSFDSSSGIAIADPPDWEQEFEEMPWRKLEHHPLNAPSGSKSMGGFLESLKPFLNLNRNLNLLVQSLERSERLHRWVDKRQPTVESLKLPKHGQLHTGPAADAQDWYKDTWSSYSYWLSLLHSRSLIKPTIGNLSRKIRVTMWNTRDYDQIQPSTAWWIERMRTREARTSFPIYNEEMKRFPGYNHYDHLEEFKWVFDWRRSLFMCLDEIYAMDHYYNSLGHGLSETHIYMDAFLGQSLPAVANVLNTLADVESRFEDALQYSHVEDVHMDKRLFIPAPDVMADAPYTFTLLDNMNFVSGYQDHLREQLRALQAQLRDRHEYRLLRDWGYGRPWKKLYYYFNNQACGEETVDAIDSIRAELYRSERASALFDVHPLILGEEGVEEEEECVICMNEYGEDDLVMELWCNHRLHAHCMFTFWDHRNRFSQSCPLCRFAPPKIDEKLLITQHGVAMREDADFFSGPGHTNLETAHKLSRYYLKKIFRDTDLDLDEIAAERHGAGFFALLTDTFAKLDHDRARKEANADLGIIPRPFHRDREQDDAHEDFKPAEDMTSDRNLSFAIGREIRGGILERWDDELPGI